MAIEIDPVCGMEVDTSTSTLSTEHDGTTYWFCGKGCLLDFQLDLRSLRAAGILPVFSAGNYGPGAGTVLSPANNPEAFAVGSTDDLDVVDPSSSRGPSACTSARCALAML